MITINYLAVLVAAIVSMALGFLWYGPVFGKQWVAMMKFPQAAIDEAKKKGMTKNYVITFVGCLVTAYVLAHFVAIAALAGVGSGVSGGLQSGFWAWLGFIATVTLGSVLWEGRSWKLWSFNNAYQLLNLLIMGAILGGWM